MKERPILFSAPMVRATLDDIKLMTRRTKELEYFSRPENNPDGWRCVRVSDGFAYFVYGNSPVERQVKCPCGQPGDRLWVREAWRAPLAYELTPPRDILRGTPIVYQADASGSLPHFNAGKLRPSMFMPRWASRITLEITGVRVERLNDISEEDAKAEGADCLITDNCTSSERELLDLPLMENGTPYRNGFALLWESINGDGSWAANPWVWVVEFRRIAV